MCQGHLSLQCKQVKLQHLTTHFKEMHGQTFIQTLPLAELT